jgi:hypothetical protein
MLLIGVGAGGVAVGRRTLRGPPGGVPAGLAVAVAVAGEGVVAAAAVRLGDDVAVVVGDGVPLAFAMGLGVLVELAVPVAVELAATDGVRVGVALTVDVGDNVALAVSVGVLVAVAVTVGVEVLLGVCVAVAVGVGVGVTSSTTTSSIIGPHPPEDVPVKVRVVKLPLLAGSAPEPRDTARHCMFVGVELVASNCRSWLVAPNATVRVFGSGPPHPGLPASAKET